MEALRIVWSKKFDGESGVSPFLCRARRRPPQTSLDTLAAARRRHCASQCVGAVKKPVSLANALSGTHVF
jgi:hypothetical protein